MKIKEFSPYDLRRAGGISRQRWWDEWIDPKYYWIWPLCDILSDVQSGLNFGDFLIVNVVVQLDFVVSGHWISELVLFWIILIWLLGDILSDVRSGLNFGGFLLVFVHWTCGIWSSDFRVSSFLDNIDMTIRGHFKPFWAMFDLDPILAIF